MAETFTNSGLMLFQAEKLALSGFEAIFDSVFV